MERKKILVVDDEKGFTDVLKLNLEATGRYEVKIVNDSTSAFNIAYRYLPDLILLDIIMPHKEGPELATEFAASDVLCQTPVVYLTATIRQEEVIASGGRIAGRNFVAKPSQLKVLLESIENNL